MKYFLITNQLDVALCAERIGVDRVMVDLEVHGKRERQGHLDTLISSHCIDDAKLICGALSHAEVIVRLNPFYSGTPAEVENAIAAGANYLMLPMFRRVDEVEQFCACVNGRVGVIPLVETYEASQVLGDVVLIEGVVEVYFGLNDLRIDMSLPFIFSSLANGMVDSMSEIARDGDCDFGFGGVARVGEGLLPAESVLGEHYRLGSSSVILSRTFMRLDNEELHSGWAETLEKEFQKLRQCEQELMKRDCQKIESDRQLVLSVISDIERRVEND